MKEQQVTAGFCVNIPDLEDVFLFIVHPDASSYFTDEDWDNLRRIDEGFIKVIDKAFRLQEVDFWPLVEPRYNYAAQETLSQARIDQAVACFLHYKGEVSMMVRFLDGEYTGVPQDTPGILATLHPYIDHQDYTDIRRILSEGAPAKIKMSYSKSNKMAKIKMSYSKSNKMQMLQLGNQRSVTKNKEIFAATINKEERYSHLVVLHFIFCRFLPWVHHVPQGMNIKNRKNPRLVWDGSTKMYPNDEVMNKDVDTTLEPEITFGNTLSNLLVEIYNQRISYPDQELWLCRADIKACFRFPRLNPDACGAFSFALDFMDVFCVSTEMVLGYIASANCWEPF
eukprot:CCRYP_014223-RA/>CCRYP_014223-RA protein AED:0.33 eAED:-0.68 QI:0/-1/0/1/-1/1/1/0/338